MTILRRFLAGLRGLLRREQAEQELDDELRSLLEMAVERKMASGMSTAYRRNAPRASRNRQR